MKREEEFEMMLNKEIDEIQAVVEFCTMSKEMKDDCIEKALLEMNRLGIRGKDETPFLLKKIVELSGGKSLEANIKLIVNNAKLGAKIAKEYQNIKV